jgi:hypothetical protein
MNKKQFFEDMKALHADFKEGDVIIVRGTIKELMYDTVWIETANGTRFVLKYKDHFMKELSRNGCIQD